MTLKEKIRGKNQEAEDAAGQPEQPPPEAHAGALPADLAEELA